MLVKFYVLFWGFFMASTSSANIVSSLVMLMFMATLAFSSLPVGMAQAQGSTGDECYPRCPTPSPVPEPSAPEMSVIMVPAFVLAGLLVARSAKKSKRRAKKENVA